MSLDTMGEEELRAYVVNLTVEIEVARRALGELVGARPATLAEAVTMVVAAVRDDRRTPAQPGRIPATDLVRRRPSRIHDEILAGDPALVDRMRMMEAELDAAMRIKTCTYVDSRPRFDYALPDGRIIKVIRDHGDVPAVEITFEISARDPLWDSADRIPGSIRRTVVARLVGPR